MVAERLDPVGLGPLALSLAKAQAEFPAIIRDKEVDSRSYKFKYAPLDSIIAAVRPALAKNGLAFVQLLDGDDLETILLHESGAMLRGRVPLPHEGTIQQYGSAVTYLRRYSLQAILGIAAEEDDDGEAAAGNQLPSRKAAATERREQANQDGLIGIASTGKGDADFELRQTPQGYALIFRIVDGRTGIKVVTRGELAEQIAEHRPTIEGQRITAWGRVETQEFTPKDTGRKVEYQVLHATRITAGDLTLPAVQARSAPQDEDVDLSGLDGPGVWGGPSDEPR